MPHREKKKDLKEGTKIAGTGVAVGWSQFQDTRKDFFSFLFYDASQKINFFSLSFSDISTM
jgi:hypothetical protein